MNRPITIFLWLPLFLSFVISQEADTLSIFPEESHDSLFPIEITVDLSGDEIPAAADQNTAHVLARPWYKNFTISGFGGFDFLKSGTAGTRPNGGFMVKEASLFIEADIWKDQSFFLEIQTNRLGEDSTMYIRTGEVYIHIRNLFESWGINGVGLKIGRIDIPFGEEYLWHDASDNPLISNSVIYPYGWDEGLLIYGKILRLGWIFSVMDGTLKRSFEDSPNQSFNGKIYGNLTDQFYSSLNLMIDNGTGMSALEFGGSHITPVGTWHASSAGISPSKKVQYLLAELDTRYSIGTLERYGHISFSVGKAQLIDAKELFSRDWTWFSLESLLKINQKIYCSARYSNIGTHNPEEGYIFDGKTTAGGIEAFGYDASSLSRISIGAGWKPNPHMVIKLEIGRDWFKLVENSPFLANNDQRSLIGLEIVSSF